MPGITLRANSRNGRRILRRPRPGCNSRQQRRHVHALVQEALPRFQQFIDAVLVGLPGPVGRRQGGSETVPFRAAASKALRRYRRVDLDRCSQYFAMNSPSVTGSLGMPGHALASSGSPEARPLGQRAPTAMTSGLLTPSCDRESPSSLPEACSSKRISDLQ